jgi:hypothetical protein
MRKKGENSVKCAGKSAITPDDNSNDFTLWGRKSIRSILLISLPFATALRGFVLEIRGETQGRVKCPRVANYSGSAEGSLSV